jgi:hypothetical protein
MQPEHCWDVEKERCTLFPLRGPLSPAASLTPRIITTTAAAAFFRWRRVLAAALVFQMADICPHF